MKNKCLFLSYITISMASDSHPHGHFMDQDPSFFPHPLACFVFTYGTTLHIFPCSSLCRRERPGRSKPRVFFFFLDQVEKYTHLLSSYIGKNWFKYLHLVFMSWKFHSLLAYPSYNSISRKVVENESW